jgi:transposase-like protein
MARPSKYRPETLAKIEEALRGGNTRRAASAYAGINENTFGRWMLRFRDFAERVTRAETAAEMSMVAVVVKAANAGDGKMAFAWLERRRHQDWGKVDRLEIEIRRTAERVAAQTGADPDWLVKRAAEIVAGESGPS